jgi:transposase-like protein
VKLSCMRAYSKDLRVKVLEAVDRRGMPRSEVARTFGISLPSIKRWLKRRRETGAVDAKAPPGPPAVKGARARRMFARSSSERSRSDPRGTLRGFRGGLRGEGIGGHDEPRHLASSGRLAAQKKSPLASERDEEMRGLWRWLASRFEARRLVFVDESGFHSGLHDAPLRQGSQRRAGLRQGPSQP